MAKPASFTGVEAASRLRSTPVEAPLGVDWPIICLFLILFMFLTLLWSAKCRSSTTENFRSVVVLPISFAIPLSMFRDPGKKTDEFSKLIPGDRKTYKTEDEYYAQYQRSKFGITMSKAGHDCMRHYEIIAAGAIPYFKDLHLVPKNTMHTFPRDIVTRAMNGENYEKCLAELQEYARKHLTTEALGKYFLEKVGLVAKSDDRSAKRFAAKSDDDRSRFVASGKRLLFISEPSLVGTNIDYQRDCLAIGLLERLRSTPTGVEVDFYEDLPWLFDDYPGDCSSLYGMGYSICKKVPASEHRLVLKSDVFNKIYDFIIVATSSSHFKLSPDITKWIEKQSTVPKALIIGNDGSFTSKLALELARKNYSFPFQFIFVRELN